MTHSLHEAGEPVTYEVLATLNFDAARKRMSVIVRSPHTNKVYLMVKGADDAVYQRLADNDANTSRKVLASVVRRYVAHLMRPLYVHRT